LTSSGSFKKRRKKEGCRGRVEKVFVEGFFVRAAIAFFLFRRGKSVQGRSESQEGKWKNWGEINEERVRARDVGVGLRVMERL